MEENLALEINEDELFERVEIDEFESEHLAAEPYSYWKSVFRVFIKKPSAIIGLVTLLLLVIAIIIIPAIAPEEYLKPHVNPDDLENLGIYKNMPPSWEHLFGTDVIGRDLFYTCFIGARKSLILALISSFVVIIVGTIFGLIWGYFRKLDPIFIEIYNLISNIPSLLLYLLLSLVIQKSFTGVTPEARLVISLSLFGWIGVSLTVRNLVLIISNRDYNIASKTLGTPPSRIMSRNLLPYIMAVIITNLSLTIPGMISSEVSMSYFGLGLPENALSIGAILNLGISMFDQYPWQLLAPGLMLAIIIFVFFLIGTSLSDALDPKTHR